VNTHLPDFVASDAALPSTLVKCFDAGLGELSFSDLRAPTEAADLARTAADDFDFAAIFFGLATALAMTENNPQGDEDSDQEMGALHHFERPGASRETPAKSYR
jgi:hypothetical protein